MNQNETQSQAPISLAYYQQRVTLLDLQLAQISFERDSLRVELETVRAELSHYKTAPSAAT